MHKIKTISVMIAVMFVCVAFASLSGAEYTLEGKIEGKVSGFAGVVSPDVNLTENQSVTLSVDITTEDNVTMYFVNDSLRIDVNITDESGRAMFFLPRSVYYGVIITRSFSDAGLLKEETWEDGFIKRLFPAKAFGALNAVDSLLGEKDTNITIELDYSVSNSTYQSGGENLTMHIIVMGFLPGDVNGVDDEGVGRVVEHKKVNLEVKY